MAREIDHRVMNSLQFISSLLAMQSRTLGATNGADQLQTAANRVAAVARVHRHFYSNEAAELSCIAFLRRLCAELSGILGQSIEVRGDEGQVPTIWIQPIGLIVNELATNAAKHGAGTITVIYRTDDGVHELSVCDEGESLPAEFDPAASATGLGMKVLTTLAHQLGGRIAAAVNPLDRGSCFTVTFPSGREVDDNGAGGATLAA